MDFSIGFNTEDFEVKSCLVLSDGTIVEKISIYPDKSCQGVPKAVHYVDREGVSLIPTTLQLTGSRSCNDSTETFDSLIVDLNNPPSTITTTGDNVYDVTVMSHCSAILTLSQTGVSQSVGPFSAINFSKQPLATSPFLNTWTVTITGPLEPDEFFIVNYKMYN